MSSLTIPYSPEVLSALHQKPEEFEAEAREILAVKLYESGRLSTGLAAELAGLPLDAFLVLLGRYDLSPFDASPETLERDLADARRAGRPR